MCRLECVAVSFLSCHPERMGGTSHRQAYITLHQCVIQASNVRSFAALRMTRFEPKRVSHLLGHFDPKKSETALQNTRREVDQCQTRAARRFFRFQDRAGLIKSVKAVCQLEEIVRQNVWTKTVQHLGN